MLNTQLQQSINEELEKANPQVKEFVESSYWRDTIALVARVNHIKDEFVIEGIELEIILLLLNMSHYSNIYEALKSEVFTGGVESTEENMRQLSYDIDEYIFKKINENKNVNAIYIDDQDDNLHQIIQREFEEHKEILPESYIKSRAAQPLKIVDKKLAPEILDIYRERVAEDDMKLGKYTIGPIKPKDRVKEIIK